MRFGKGAESLAGQTQQLVGGEDATKAFMTFYDETNVENILSSFDAVCESLDIHPGRLPDFFPVLRNCLEDKLSYKYKEIWKILEKRTKLGCYGDGKIGGGLRVLIVGAGPVGLRTAIETQLLGCRTVIVEGRTSFTRNNVLKLWKFLIEDLKLLGIKKLYGKFCSGNINHVCIRTLQTVLLKVCCMLGVQVYTGVKFQGLQEPEDDMGWHAKLLPEDHEARHFSFDVVIGASGKAVSLPGFNRYKMDAKLAIAITCNFVNEGSKEEAFVNEISGVQKQYHQKFFDDLEKSHGIKLENLIYYKDLTHYFVMAATKDSLLTKGVLKTPHDDRAKLLSSSNVDRDKLEEYAKQAALFSTGYYSRRLPHTRLSINARGEPDISIFDFTNLYAARNSCRAVVRKGFPLLLSMVGDSLLEPFWPEGTGCARGFLSALDAAWMVRAWALQTNPLQVLEERENIFSLLSQTTDDGLRTCYKSYTLDPRTRYKNIPRPLDKDEKIINLYDTDNKEEMRYLEEKFRSKSYFDSMAYQNILRRYKAFKRPFARQFSLAGASKALRVLSKKSSRAKESVLQKLGKTQKTRDDNMEDLVDKFKHQELEVCNLDTAFTDYLSALKTVEIAESKLMTTWAANINDWENLENFNHNTQAIREQRKNNVTNLTREVVVPMNTYKDQFKEIKGEVDKCQEIEREINRSEYIIQQLELAGNTSKLDGTRSKAKLIQDKHKTLVSELESELPLLYGARREFYATNLQAFFNLQQSFHKDVSFIFRDMSEYVLIKLKNV